MLLLLLFQKRGIEGCVVSTESIGVVAVSLWEPMRLHLSWPRRDRDCGCGMLRSSQLRGDPVPNRSSACDFEFSETERVRLSCGDSKEVLSGDFGDSDQVCTIVLVGKSALWDCQNGL